MGARKRSFGSRVSQNAKRRTNRALNRLAAPIVGPVILVAIVWMAWQRCTGAPDARLPGSKLEETSSSRERLVQAETERVRAAFRAKAPTTLSDASAVIGIPPTECGRSASTQTTYAQWRFRASIPEGDTRVYIDPKARNGAGEPYLGAPIKLKVRTCNVDGEVLEVVGIGAER